MPFLAAPAILGPLIGGAASLGASALGSKLSNTSGTPDQRAVLQQQLQAMRTGQVQAGQMFPQAHNLLNMGTQGFQPVLNYYSSILSGNRPAMTSALAPEIGRIGQGYQAATTTSAALNPRTGPSVSFNAELPFAQQRDVSTLLQTARPAAAQGLFSASQGVTSAGQGLFSNAVNALYGGTSAGQSILAQQQQQQLLNAQRGQDIGGGIFSAFQRYGMPAIMKGLGGGDTGQA